MPPSRENLVYAKKGHHTDENIEWLVKQLDDLVDGVDFNKLSPGQFAAIRERITDTLQDAGKQFMRSGKYWK